jgi:hypothetical protein
MLEALDTVNYSGTSPSATIQTHASSANTLPVVVSVAKDGNCSRPIMSCADFYPPNYARSGQSLPARSSPAIESATERIATFVAFF